MRPRTLSTIPIAALALAAAVSTTARGSGELTQKRGEDGCVSFHHGSCKQGRALVGAEAVAISPDGRSVYVISYEAESLSIFHRNPSTGELRQEPGAAGCISEHPKLDYEGPCRDGRAIEEPSDVVVSPDGENIYVASSDSNAVAVFDRDPATGAVRELLGAVGCVSATGSDGSGEAVIATTGSGSSGGACLKAGSLQGPTEIAISPDGRNVYVASAGRLEESDVRVDSTGRSITILDRDSSTGALTPKPGRAGCISGTGNGGACQFTRGLGEAFGIDFSPDGKNAYVTSTGPDAVTVFDRDLATGALARKLGTAGCISKDALGGVCKKDEIIGSPNGVAVSADGRNVYVTLREVSGVAIFDRDPATGVLRRKSGSAGCTTDDQSAGPCRDGQALRRAGGVAVSPDGRNVYVSSYAAGHTLAVFDRDPETGSLRQKRAAASCVASVGQLCRKARGMSGPGDLAISPDSKNVYAVSILSGVAIFDRARR